MDATGNGRAGPGTGDLDGTVVALAELMARRRNGRWISCAETFTGGLLSRSLSAVDDAPEWFAGGVVVPDVARRRQVLGVRAPDEISEGCAVQMALDAVRSALTSLSRALSEAEDAGAAPTVAVPGTTSG